jgi:hypothetical protein
MAKANKGFSPLGGLFAQNSENSPTRNLEKSDFTLRRFDMSGRLPHTFPMPFRAVHFAFGAGLSVILIEGVPV